MTQSAPQKPPSPPPLTARVYGRLVGLTRHHIVIALGFQDLEIPLASNLDRKAIGTFFGETTVVDINNNEAAPVKPPNEGKRATTPPPATPSGACRLPAATSPPAA